MRYMFPNPMNPVDSRKVSELWEDEKKYRWWIIAFASSLLILFGLNLALVIISYLYQTDLLTYFTNIVNSIDPNFDNLPIYVNSQFDSMAMTLIGMTVAFFLASTIFIYSIFNSYKLKSFEKLDSFSSFFLGFQTFFTLFSLFQLIGRTDIYFGNSEVASNPIMICYFVLPFFTVPVWLLLSRQIKKIKRTFFMAKRQEELEAFYEANQGQSMDPNNNPYQQQNPFGFPFQQKKQKPIPQPQNGELSPTNNMETDSKFSKLQLMTVHQLRKIAERLSISGNKEMKKPELIKTILSVSQSLEAQKKNDDNVNKDQEDDN